MPKVLTDSFTTPSRFLKSANLAICATDPFSGFGVAESERVRPSAGLYFLVPSI